MRGNSSTITTGDMLVLATSKPFINMIIDDLFHSNELTMYAGVRILSLLFT